MAVEKIIKSVQDAYIEIMGQEAWDRMSNKEKHDLVMLMVTDLDKIIYKMIERG